MASVRDRLTILLGLWTVCTATPSVAYLVAGPFTAAVTPTEAGLGSGLFVVGTGGAAMGLRSMANPAERFRDGIELGGPLAVASGVMFAAVPVSLTDGILAALPFAIGGALGFFTAFLVGYVADQAVIARARASSDHRLRWSATKRPEATWVRAMRVIGAVAALGLAVLVGTAGGQLLAAFWGVVGLLQFGLLVGSRKRRRYELTDTGLITAFGHLPWEQFDAYGITDNALLLYGNVWPFGTIAYDRDSVDDLDGVLEALDRYLPRQEGSHQDPSVVDACRRLLSSS